MEKRKQGNRVPTMTAEEAIRMVPSNAVVAFLGAGGGIVEPTALINALADRYDKEQEPKHLTFWHTLGLGDRAEKGMSVLAKPGLCRRLISSHYAQSPRLADMVDRNEVEAYCFPMGVMAQLIRAAAAGQPGIVTTIGIGTYIDPRQTGGKLNERTKEDLVKVININGKECLFYHTVKPDVAFIRGSTADEEGYISMEDETAFLDILAEASATKNNGGLVIAQVQKLVRRGTLHPKNVKVPGYCVDAVVVVPEQTQLYNAPLNRFMSGDYIQPQGDAGNLPLDQRKIIARRALMEVMPGDVGNVGVGISDAVGTIAAEEGVNEDFTLTVEQGPIGGVSARGIFFGATVNAKAIIDLPSMFDFYHGGGLDICFLSFAEVDRHGNVNVSRFNHKVTGVGGFVDISSGSKKVVFSGTFTAGGLRTVVDDGTLHIVNEGRFKKFRNDVEEVSFSGENAIRTRQEVVYLTERATFRLTAKGVELFEIAEGIDLERDILAYMEFIPLIAEDLKRMDRRLFREDLMGIREEWMHKGVP